MHCALATKLFCCAAVIAGHGPLAFGCRLAHACCAAWNAGASGLMSGGRLTLPSGLGSGKVGTPWERMQSAYLIPWGEAPEAPEAAVLVALLEDPQAAIATAPVTAASAIDRPRRWLLGALLLLAQRISRAPTYGTDGNKGVNDVTSLLRSVRP